MEDPLVRFRFSDGDEAGNPQYQGMLATNGDWYILRIDTALNQHRYVRGRGNYETAVTGAWATRAALSYDYLHLVFGV